MVNLAQHWQDNAHMEVEFWRKLFADMATDGLTPEFERRFDADATLHPIVKDAITTRSGDIRILDVGAGPVTDVGYRYSARSKRAVVVDAIDTLADDYNAILEEHGFEPPVRTEAIASSEIASMFPRSEFDVVFCQNALDHMINPVDVLKQMAYVCKPGGAIVLVHAVNEGEYWDYQGLHLWNIDREGDALVIWGNGLVHVVHEAIDGFAVESLEVDDSGDKPWIAAVLRKHE